MSAFVLVTLLLCYGFAHYYIPPSPSYRLVPDLSLTTATIGALVLSNCIIAVGWRIMPLWPFMTRYFMHVPGYPRAAQSVLNVFSHVQYEHLLSNMFTLMLVGPVCCDLVGRGTFMGTYVAAGAFGTLTTLWWANLGRGNISAHSVGASAAIWGISALYLLLTDQERLKIPFIKDAEVSFWPKMLFVGVLALELRTLFTRKTQLDHASHFGGMAVGMVVAAWLRYTGFHEHKGEIVDESNAKKADVDGRTADLGAIVSQGMREVRQSVSKSKKDE